MVEKRVKKFGQGPPPPFSGNARKKSIFVMGGVPLDKSEARSASVALHDATVVTIEGKRTIQSNF